MAGTSEATLQAQLDAVNAQITAYLSGGIKPSYTADGRKVDWTQHLRELRAMARDLEAQIVALRNNTITVQDIQPWGY